MSGRHNLLVRSAFARAKVMMLAMVMLSVIGIATLMNAPREADPDIDLPFVSVVLPLPGVSPQDAERLLIRPTETELQRLEGLVQYDANAYEGVAVLRLEFEPDLDMGQVTDEVRVAVDRAKADYPPETKEPLVDEVNAQSLFPVISVVLSGEAPERALYAAAKTLEERLKGVEGVLDVELTGARDEVVEVIVSAATLQNYGLTPREIGDAIRRNNVLVTAGAVRLEGGSFAVTIDGLLSELEDIGSVPVRTTDTDTILLEDIAELRRTFAEPTGYARFNGETAIGLNVSKRSGANMLDLTRAVKAATEETATAWPATIAVSYVGDQSTMVEGVFDSLSSSIGLAIILVMIVLVGALDLRSALLVGIAIPGSLLIGLAFMGLYGFTLNQLVMFSLVLAIGMLVDGAIVIVEFADRRMAEGETRRNAYIEASERMFLPVVASTATTLAAFVPFLFWNAIEGHFMRWIPLTLIFVLTASLLMALLFLPILGAAFRIPDGLKRRFELKGKSGGTSRLDLDNVDPMEMRGATGAYARFVGRMVQRPILIITLGIMTVLICSRIFTLSNVEVEEFIRYDSEQVIVVIEARGNLSEADALAIAEDVQRQTLEHPAVEMAFLRTGRDLSRQNDTPSATIALINLDLVPYQDRRHSRIVLEELRRDIANVPGTVIEVRVPDQGPVQGKDVQIELSALRYDDALAAAAVLRDFLEEHMTSVDGVGVPTFMEIEDSLPLPGIEWSPVIDRAESARFGLSVANVGAYLQLGTEGLIIDRFRPDDADEELDIRLRYPDAERSVTGLVGTSVVTPVGTVPLTNVADLEPQPQNDRILRRDGRRIVEIKANANTSSPSAQVSQDRATDAAIAYLESGALSDAVGTGIEWKVRGAAEDRNASQSFFRKAMLAAMFMIGTILLLQFNSFYHAFLTLTAVILSVFGVLLGVALSGQYVSVIMTGVGIVALAGIVVNNNIVLIDTHHALRRTGASTTEAAIRSAAQRLRPVLLTTSTTIIGLLPMVLEIDIDFARARVGIGNEVSDWWVLMSSAIVYGLAFSTLLTLILTPVMLAAPEVLGDRWRRWRGTATERRRPVARLKAAFRSPDDESARSAAE